MKLLPLILGLAMALPLGNALAASPRYTGSELAKQAKISLAGARGIALKARPGKIVDQELEKEAGGSGLRYAFDIASRGKTYEVGVDATSGKVLENGVETAAQEKAELKAEKKK